MEQNSSGIWVRRIISLFSTAVAVYFADWLFVGIYAKDFWTALWVALLLGVLNAFVKPFLQLISVPLILVTFGLFLLVINAVMLLFVNELVSDFRVDGFWSALWGSLVISLVTYLINPPRKNNGDNGVKITVNRG